MTDGVNDDLLQRLRRFHDDYFPGVEDHFKTLVKDGQHPSILFIGCSDSRIVPYLLTGTGPGELFIVRNVGAFVPPYDGSAGIAFRIAVCIRYRSQRPASGSFRKRGAAACARFPRHLAARI